MLYEFKKENSAAKVDWLIDWLKWFEAHGEESLNERTCRRGFEKFRSGNFNLEDEHRTGRQVELDDELLVTLLKKSLVSVEEYGVKPRSNCSSSSSTTS